MVRVRVLIAVLLLLGAALVASAAGAPTLTISAPSPNETLMAEMRDFYVMGPIPAGMTTPGDIRVEVFRGANATGTPVRVVESHVDPATGTTPLSAIEADYPNGSSKGTLMVPDLVCEPGGFLETWNKVVVTPEYYAGLVFGGASRHFDTNYTDREGRPLQDLVAGDYTVRVTGLSGELEGHTAEMRITLGKTHAALGRFSPPVQRDRLIAFANERGYRTYQDSFPGYFYWNSSGFVVPGRWVVNNAIEVVNDCPGTLADMVGTAENDLFLYDIRNYSATYTVEVSTLIRTGVADSPRTVYHFYDEGEPAYSYVARENGTPVQVVSLLSRLPHADRLALTRAELRSPGALDPVVDLADATPKRVDFSPDDGITVETDETCLLYGVVAPIPAPVVPGPSGKDGKPTNRIASIDWTLESGAGAVVAGSTIPVELGRRTNPAKPTEIVYSSYEFGGPVGAGVPAGQYMLRIEGRDETGAVVDGTVEVVPFTIGTSPTPTGTATVVPTTGAPTPTITVTVVPTTVAPTVLPTRPPATPHVIPGRIEAEDYDAGRYRDTTRGNTGREYRQDDVDIERGGANFNVGWVKSSEWLEYTISARQAGTYRTSFRVATPWSGRQVWVWVDGARTAVVDVPRTGSFGAWRTVTVPVSLTAGAHRLRVQFVGDAQNLDWFEFRR
ncbi:MAG: carbohydrate-binding protein [Methanoregulaceae archaeon]